LSPTLTLSGDFAHPDLDSLCDELRGLPEWPADEPASVDLRELQSMEPTTMAVLLASLEGLHRRRLCNPLEDLEPPRYENGVKCLHPQALNDLFVDGDGHWQEIDGATPTIIGCEVFTGASGVDDITAGLSQQLAIHTEWSSSSLKSLGSMIFELSENVIQHSQAKGGVAVLRISPTEQRIALAIADNGVGIRESLARNPDFSDIGDDLTAIAKAMGPRATGEPGTGGGMGLFLARCITRSNGGTFIVRSGEACREENAALSDSGHLPYLHGTLVGVEARTDLPFEHDDTISAALSQRVSAAPN
jgi:anti-sigma regulatory factor (Ser/Thr protein kinase)